METKKPVCDQEALDLLNCVTRSDFHQEKCLRLLLSLRECVLNKSAMQLGICSTAMLQLLLILSLNNQNKKYFYCAENADSGVYKGSCSFVKQLVYLATDAVMAGCGCSLIEYQTRINEKVKKFSLADQMSKEADSVVKK